MLAKKTLKVAHGKASMPTVPKHPPLDEIFSRASDAQHSVSGAFLDEAGPQVLSYGAGISGHRPIRRPHCPVLRNSKETTS